MSSTKVTKHSKLNPPSENAQSFLLMSDMPYLAKNYKKHPPRLFEPTLVESVFPQLVNPQKHLFLVHTGDIKGGGELCTKSLLKKRLRMISKIYPGHIYYTPGDNEWTDCDRDKKTSELETLAYLRKNLSLVRPRKKISEKFQTQYQKKQPENSIWRSGDIQFASIHITGTGFGRARILVDDIEVAQKAADAREQNNLDWLERLSQHLENQPAKALVLFFHADIVDLPTKILDVSCQTDYKNCDVYKKQRDAMKKLAQKVQIPVLWVHGDTGEYCLDQPYPQISNLWRFNGPGDYQISDLIEVIVDPASEKHPFRAKGRMVSMSPPKSCH